MHKVIIVFFMVFKFVGMREVVAESFVKEKIKQNKKVALGHCQEVMVPLCAGLIDITNDVAKKVGALECCLLEIQREALNVTMELLDEEQCGGRFQAIPHLEFDVFHSSMNQVMNEIKKVEKVMAQMQIDLQKSKSALAVVQDKK